MLTAEVRKWRKQWTSQGGRRFLIPEVIQTSSMDCGPAALSALLNGLGIGASYGRLREACQTEVDGTSIDTLQDMAARLGLVAEQMVIPGDHILLDVRKNLPAIAVVRHENGVPHFVVCWRLDGEFVQVMDPATGRHWQHSARFLQRLFVHTQPVPVAAIRKWLGGNAFTRALTTRMRQLGIPQAVEQRLLQSPRSQGSWQAWAQLDAAVRMASDLIATRAVSSGAEAGRFVEALAAHRDAAQIPDSYWTVRPLAGEAPVTAQVEQVLLRGAVLVAIRGRRVEDVQQQAQRVAALPADLRAALVEAPLRPLRSMFRLLPRTQLGLLALAMAAAAVAAALQVELDALFRSMLHVLGFVRSPTQRLMAPLLVVAFASGLFGLVLVTQWNITRVGRYLEIKLRSALLAKLPRLNDHYFHSRPISDMTERAHSIARVRQLPQLFVDVMRSVAMTTLTAAALFWVAPQERLLVFSLLLSVLGMSFLIQPWLIGLDMRLRTYAGTLMRSYLDALIGLSPTRTHGAERTLVRDQEEVLTHWARVRLDWLRAQVSAQGVQVIIGYLFIVWIIARYLDRGGDAAGLLLLYYWAMALPGNAGELAQSLQQYPDLRNVTMRLIEPLGAPAESEEDSASVLTVREAKTISISLRDVSVVLSGRPVLKGVNLDIAAGTHVAVVGVSGAGKSTLIGLLLGFHRAASGTLRINGIEVSNEELVQLRSQVAWVDPDIRLWNRSLFDNLHYGQASDRVDALSEAIATADLSRVMGRLPAGLATALGEGGRLVSGGEGQRVRLGRTLLQSTPQLVLLDEPFRGLDRTQRQELLDRTRKKWERTTLIYVSHDIATTLSFPLVVVIEDGTLVESGPPLSLSNKPDSRFAKLLRAEKAVRHDLWASKEWQRIAMVDGQLVSGKERDGSQEES
ncbi:MAG: ATP-binding cassette domain-containing protein [Myxococcales bacterium]|nr:ATP-binding cassette domain-containing protein [Myxococcales bacterium]